MKSFLSSRQEINYQHVNLDVLYVFFMFVVKIFLYSCFQYVKVIIKTIRVFQRQFC